MERLGCHLLALLLPAENNFCRSSLQEREREVNATFFESQLFALFVSSLSSDWPYMACCSPSSTEHLTGEEPDQLTRQVSRGAGWTDLSFEDDRLQMNDCANYTLPQTPFMFSANKSLLGIGSWLRWPYEYLSFHQPWKQVGDSWYRAGEERNRSLG